MYKESDVVILNKELILSKEGYEDIVYAEGTLLKVMMVSNDHIVVNDDNQEHTFILDHIDQDTLWSFL